ncbi:MAG: HlyC/CorC family transporter [Rhodothermia bacterium]|nr:HlyC/CorC family transporter [Rhodothermia bacterium]
MLTELIIIGVLILINGVFSMSEIAVVQARKARLEAAAKREIRGASQALKLAAEPTRFLSSVQIGITLVGILNGFFSGGEITVFIKNTLKGLHVPYAEAAAIGIVVIAITFLSLVFGELLPKRIGMSNPENIARLVAGPMTTVSKITAPFIWLLTATTELFIRLFGIKTDGAAVTEEEIKAIVGEGATAGTIEAIEQDIVENVFHLGDKRVGSLMTHRSDLVWLDLTDDWPTIRSILVDEQHDVYPICEESLDRVLGLIHLKDLVVALTENTQPDLRKIIRPAIFFPENVRAWKVLERFREEKTHQGFVVDEFGQLLGLVTMDDIFEALFGDLIPKEDDDQEDDWIVKRDGQSWLVDARLPYDDFLREFDIIDDQYRHGEFYTISGFVLQKLRRLPKVGDTFEWRNYRFEIVDMDNNRVDKLMISEVAEN